MKHALYFVVLLGLLATGCRDKNKPTPEEPANPENPTTGTLKIVVSPNYNGAPFAFNTDYNTPLNQRLQFEMLKFLSTYYYVHTTAGDSIMIKDAFKYDMATGPVSFTATLNPGTFTGLHFYFGVDSARNNSDPSLYDPSHALSYNQANTLHWGWASGYVFMKMEAKADLSGTGTGPLNQFITFHPGNNQCYRKTPFLPKAFSITAGQTTQLTLSVDIARFIAAPADTFDFGVDHTTHFSDNPALANRVADHFIQAISLP